MRQIGMFHTALQDGIRQEALVFGGRERRLWPITTSFEHILPIVHLNLLYR